MNVATGPTKIRGGGPDHRYKTGEEVAAILLRDDYTHSRKC